MRSSKLQCHNSRLQEKSTTNQRSNAKKLQPNWQKRNAESIKSATVPITPQMIRDAVKQLHTRRIFISSALIASHLRHRYPIENDPDALKEELEDKLNCAVSVGLIVKCGDDKYGIPTLRQQASLNKTAITAFWDAYYKGGPLSTREESIASAIPRVRIFKKRASPALKYRSECGSEPWQNTDRVDN